MDRDHEVRAAFAAFLEKLAERGTLRSQSLRQFFDHMVDLISAVGRRTVAIGMSTNCPLL
jgi:hypothetical protein